MSGANKTPLGRFEAGTTTRLEVARSSSLLKPSYMSESGNGDHHREEEPKPEKRGRWDREERTNHDVNKRDKDESTSKPKREKDVDNNSNDSTSRNSADAKEERRRKRKSRWGDSEKDRVIIPGLPTMLPPNLTQEQEKIYLLQLQIEEVSRKLRTGDLGIPSNPEARSPSPEPIYNNEGKRLNTREFRTRKKLEDDRHSLIQQMSQINPVYKPPADYKPPQQKISEKVLIPQEEYPDINFVGLLIGPRGNTLKSMERDTTAKIIIRGKGSVKEGKIGRKDGQPMPGEDEPLHAFVTGSTQDSVTRAVARIREVIRQGIEVPENQNDLRRNQLRELALLNGTLRESDGPRCSNCGANDHRSWQCPDKPNVTNNVVCSSCGGTGHIARDCKERGKSSSGTAANAKIDEEYLSLMAELGQGAPPPKKPSASSMSFGGGSGFMGMNSQSQAPKAIAAPPPPPPPSNQSGLLPTPPGQANNWGSDPNQWAQNAAYGNGASAGYDAAAYAQMYSQQNPAWMQAWMQQAATNPASVGNPWASYLQQPPPPPPPM
ncbi:Splicing factor 1 [Halotydeus destructor]|nr:Splicing factor 1 [Halotydeus destructor]